MSRIVALLGALLLVAPLPALAHMSIFHPSVYGFANTTLRGTLQDPLGPGLDFDAWWLRGPAVRANAPTARYDLPAGGTVELQTACNAAYTSFGDSPSVNGSYLDACPNSPGPYHLCDSNSATDDDEKRPCFDPTLAGGCALGISMVSDIAKAAPQDFAIFSVNHSCVTTKVTTFSIPAAMPPCPGGKCLCVWYWLANTGTGNYYNTAFDCNVVGSRANATAIAQPTAPTFCAPGVPGSVECAKGAKYPIYYYNNPNDLNTGPPSGIFNSYRPSYSSKWSFGQDGAQDDIFVANSSQATLVGSKTPARRRDGIEPLLPGSALEARDRRARQSRFARAHPRDEE